MENQMAINTGLVIILVMVVSYYLMTQRQDIIEKFVPMDRNTRTFPVYTNDEMPMFRIKINDAGHQLDWNNYTDVKTSNAKKFSILSANLTNKEKLIGQTYNNKDDDNIDTQSLVLYNDTKQLKNAGFALPAPTGYKLQYSTGLKFSGKVDINIPAMDQSPARKIKADYSSIASQKHYQEMSGTLSELENLSSKLSNSISRINQVETSIYNPNIPEWYGKKNSTIKLYQNATNYVNPARQDLIGNLEIKEIITEVPRGISGMVIPFGVRVTVSGPDTRQTFYMPQKYNGKTITDIRKNDNNSMYNEFMSQVSYDNSVDQSYWHINNLSNGGKLYGDLSNKITAIQIEFPEDTKNVVVSEKQSEYEEIYGTLLPTLEKQRNSVDDAIKRLNAIKDRIGKEGMQAYLKCYRLTAPDKYVAIGDIFVSNEAELVKFESKYGCVPDHCYRRVRDWQPSDIVYKGDGYNIYYNPYTYTLHGDNEGFVGKLVACPQKDTTAEVLIDKDLATREACKKYSKIREMTPVIPNGFSKEEDAQLERKVYDQAQRIAALKEHAIKLNKMTSENKLINQEHNRIRLQEHINKQRANIDLGIKKLQKESQQIAVNIRYPVALLRNLMDIIANSDTIPHDVKVETIKKLKDIETDVVTRGDGGDYLIDVNDALRDCPLYDLSEYVKKDNIPCFGCRLP